MFGNKEDKSKLPDLPPSPVPLRKSLSGVPTNDVRMHDNSMPTFPDKPGQGFSQAAIKGAVGEGGNDHIGLPPPKKMNVVEMEEWRPNEFESENMKPFPTGVDSDDFGDDDEEEDEMPSQRIAPPPKFRSSPPPEKSMGPSDVYVRIDKFHSARKALSDVKEKLQEVDDFVRKIREIKMREEQELTSWEKDIMHIKTRVQHVSENIFEKVE